MHEQTPSGGFPMPDAFARPGQSPAVPTPAYDPYPAFPPPDAAAQPYAVPGWTPPVATGSYAAPAAPMPMLAGATAVGGRRRSSWTPRVLAGVGSIVAVAVLVTASGLFSGRSSVPAPQTGTRPAASAPATTAPATTAPATTAPGSGTVQRSTQSEATEAQSKGVVLIDTVLPNGAAAGTGMVLDASGLVLTNYHVVQGSTSVKATLATTGETFTAHVVGHDAVNDVALLKLVGASGLPTVTIDTDAVGVGQTVTAVGNANGQEFLSAASGQLTDTHATVTVSNESATGTETLSGVYATNAAAQPGDSGGPLFDAQTEVTGMTTAGEQTYRGPRTGAATTVVSYAIPIAKALAIVSQIESGTSTATVKIGPNAYLGIMVATASTGSAVVSQVSAGTPAAKAGITSGSRITAIGGTKVASQAAIAAQLSGHRPGDTVSVGWVDSSGASHTADVTLAASPVN